ncbi:MAG: 4Fe-4S binding protein [Synergistetes bacterium]|nr:4Fe-4S binding protein [Synergistota bacterium]MDW8192675.1 4Fe-4S binding protein [Synergistota bacterium]
MASIIINGERCKSCGLCVKACPRQLIAISDKLNSKGYRYAIFIDASGKCIGCAFCAVSCPDVAIEVYR